jgi:uncharacterized membrane protein YesL
MRSCKTPARRGSLWKVVAWVLSLGFTLLAVFGVFAAVAAYEMGKALAVAASQMIADFAVLASLIATLALALVMVAAMMLLQTPPLFIPFGPVASVLWCIVAGRWN